MSTEIQYSNVNFGQSAMHLAFLITEQTGVPVRFSNSGTASTDGQVINIPAFKIKNKREWEMVDGYLLHEASHIKFTDFEVFKKPEAIIRHITNIFEDMRIEHELPKTFPGTKEKFIRLRQRIFLPDKSEDAEDSLSFQEGMNGVLDFCLWQSMAFRYPMLDFSSVLIEGRAALETQFPSNVVAQTVSICKDAIDSQSTEGCVDYAKKLLELYKEAYEEEKEKVQQFIEQLKNMVNSSSDMDSDSDPSENNQSGGKEKEEDNPSQQNSNSKGSTSKDTKSDENDSENSSSDSASDSDEDNGKSDTKGQKTSGSDKSESEEDNDKSDCKRQQASGSGKSESDEDNDKSDSKGQQASGSDKSESDDDGEKETGLDDESQQTKGNKGFCPNGTSLASDWDEILDTFNLDKADSFEKRLSELLETIEIDDSFDCESIPTVDPMPSIDVPVSLTDPYTKAFGILRQAVYDEVMKKSRPTSQGLRLNKRKLARAGAGLEQKPFLGNTPKRDVDTYIHILMDCSVSMAKHHMDTANYVVNGLRNALASTKGITIDVSGFSSSLSNGSAGVYPMSRTSKNIGYTTVGGTPILEALNWAYFKCFNEHHARKIIFLVTDGTVGESYAKLVKERLQTFNKYQKIQTIGIFLQVENFLPIGFNITSADELPKALRSIWKNLLYPDSFQD